MWLYNVSKTSFKFLLSNNIKIRLMKNEFELHLYKSEYNEYLAIKRNSEDQVINCYMDSIKFIHNIDFETLSIVLSTIHL